MLAVFQRMTKGVLAILGEDSFLRDSVPCRVNIEHGVQTTGPDGFTVLERSVATIPMFTEVTVGGITSRVSIDPKVGDVLTHPEGSFKLDAETADNGSSRRFVVLPLEP